MYIIPMGVKECAFPAAMKATKTAMASPSSGLAAALALKLNPFLFFVSLRTVEREAEREAAETTGKLCCDVKLFSL